MHSPYSYNVLLVAVSVGLAVMAAFVALTIMNRSFAAQERHRYARTAAGAVTLGAGIWAMHYSGLLSLNLHAAVTYDGPLTLLSLLLGVSASFIGLHAAVYGPRGRLRWWAAGFLIGFAILSLHVTGMMAMKMPYRIHLHLPALMLILLLGSALSRLSIRLALHSIPGRPGHKSRHPYVLYGSLVMTAAISGTHYAAMYATRLIPEARGGVRTEASGLAAFEMSHTVLGLIVGAVALMMATGLSVYLVLTIRRESYNSRLREQQYKSLYERHPQAVYTLDLEGCCTGTNPAFEALTGYTAEELMHRPVTALAASDSVRSLKDQVFQASFGISQSGEIAWQHKNGGLAHSVSTHIPIRMKGRTVGIYGFVHDVTGLKRAMEARDRMAKELRKSNERLMRIQQIAGMGIWDTDLKTGRAHWSPETYKIFDLSPDTPVSTRLFRYYLHPDDRELVRRSVDSAKSGEPFQCEYRIVRPDKEIRTIWCQGEALFDEDGAAYRMWGLVLDITDRRKTEEILRKSDRMLIVSQLAAGVAHEIRNPLTSIKGFLQISKPHLQDLHYRVMLSELERIEQIIREFLLIAKPQPMESFRDSSLGGILENVISLVNTQAVMNNIWIVYEPLEEIPAIRCNENQLKQVFINIVQNAIEAMPDGGEILIRTGLAEHGGVRVSIRDHGVGIPAERIKRLGEPYYTSKEKGTGLGLTICQGIIEAHGGSMAIASEVNRGTEVVLHFPQPQTQPQMRAKASGG
ncbi:ATP-binding protein [Gorillibacterium sp. sgz5001074]|uniref:ATP-binding protein n=1 Tax=Gorillibacterium sp. sgz5001074 TaxID=3446695 RepID=UPI003F6694A7